MWLHSNRYEEMDIKVFMVFFFCDWSLFFSYQTSNCYWQYIWNSWPCSPGTSGLFMQKGEVSLNWTENTNQPPKEIATAMTFSIIIIMTTGNKLPVCYRLKKKCNWCINIYQLHVQLIGRERGQHSKWKWFCLGILMDWNGDMVDFLNFVSNCYKFFKPSLFQCPQVIECQIKWNRNWVNGN